MRTWPNINCNVGVRRGDAVVLGGELRGPVETQGAALEVAATYRSVKAAKKGSFM